MATSGVYGTVEFTVASLLDLSARKAGTTTAKISAEDIDVVLMEMQLYLTGLVNRGINLWKIEEILLPLVAGQRDYNLPNSTVDILTGNLRTSQYASDPDSQVVTASSITDVFSSSTRIVACDFIVVTGGTWTFVVEGSADGFVWNPVLSIPQQTYVDNTKYAFNLTTQIPYVTYRLRETGGLTIDIESINLASIVTDIPLYRSNQDDWQNLGNKFSGSRPTQFLMNRMRDVPFLTMWPVPTEDTPGIFQGTRTLYIQDLTEINQTIDAPARWYEHFMWETAFRMISSGVGDINRLGIITAERTRTLMEAEAEERDNSPIYLSPIISGYTR